MNETRPHTLALSAIDPDHRWSLHQDLSQSPDGRFLARVRAYGILRPPLVQKIDRDRYRLICGSLRLQALEQLAKHETTCLVLTPSLSLPQLLDIVARDQGERGLLTPIEAARLVLLAHENTGDDAELWHSVTGIANRGHLLRLPRLLKLEPRLREQIHRGVISARTGLLLTSLTGDDRLFLGDLFEQLEINDNKQQRVIDWSRIIATTEELSLRDLFADRYGFCVAVDSSANRPQIVQRLLQDLQRHSHPRLSRAQREFEDRLAALHLPHHCRVTPGTSFETDRVTLSVDFPSLDHLEALWPSLQARLQK
ncbi:MAG: ParB/Srx family N-terminal domain-containing protein [Desulfofustis sp.]|jgi:ParB-like chromosome segregation protein Spo0J|nr:ParB/Srx family N-terminal domain-containing protein [Desulfofustis sp.]